MRILHIYSGNLFGGIERLLLTIAGESTPAFGMEHRFALCFKGRLSEELRTSGATTYDLTPVRFSRPWSVWAARRKLKAIIVAGDIDLIVAHSSWSQILAYPVARSTKTPSVFWVHDAMGHGHWLDRMARSRPPTLCLANSRYTRETVRRAMPSALCRIQHYPVPAPSYVDSRHVRRDVRRELGVSDETLVVVMASRLDRWKGHTLLLHSLVNITTGRAWECWIAGGVQRPAEDEYLRELKDLVTHLGLESKVRWLGDRRDVARIFTAADIHCQPNLSPEPFGIAFIEALYCGLPVVTVAGGGPDEMVDASCGFSIPLQDPIAIGQVLTRLINDDALRAELGGSGPAKARELCDPPARLQELKEVFADAIARYAQQSQQTRA